MNQIVFTIVLTTFFSLFSLIYYHRMGNKNKRMLSESLTRNVFFSTFVAPLVGAALFSYLISLVFKEGDREVFFKSDVIILTLMFYLYGVFSVAQGMHALAKSSKPQVIKAKDQKLVKLIHYFHGPFSHFVSNFSFTLIFSLFLIFNTNHPSKNMLKTGETTIIVICGVILGVILAVNYVLGNITQIMRWVVFILFVSLFLVEKSSRETILHAPLSVLVLTSLGTSMFIMFIDSFGPKRHWFIRRIDNTLVSVNKDWYEILTKFDLK